MMRVRAAGGAMRPANIPDPGNALRVPGLGAMGDYGVTDPNVYPGGVTPLGSPYNERQVFNGTPEGHGAAPDGATAVHQIGNVTGPTATYVFNTSAVNKQVVGANDKRAYLLIQNYSAFADMFVNFQSDAGLNQGLLIPARTSYTWDQFCPTGAVYVWFDSGITLQSGVAIEGTDE
jgi:hypothetical protein